MTRKLLLVLGPHEPSAVLADLPAHGFDLVLARTPIAAEAVLRERPVALAIACPEATDAAVEELVSLVARTRALPVLAIREHKVPETWKHLGVGVLRPPLLPGALARSVEVVLGLHR